MREHFSFNLNIDAVRATHSTQVEKNFKMQRSWRQGGYSWVSPRNSPLNAASSQHQRQQPGQQQQQESTQQQHQQPKSSRKPGIRFMLKDHSDIDKKWLMEQETWNNQQMSSHIITIGSWQIVAQKWVRLEFKPTTGETWVVFEQHPNKHGFFTGLKLSNHQWQEFQAVFNTILQYVSMAESGGSWQNVSRFNPLHHYEEKKKKFLNGTFQESVRFPACDDDVYVTLTSYDSTSFGGCTVDIRKCTFTEDDNKQKHLVHLLKGLTIVGGGFHYMTKYLQPRINVGIQMCDAMFIAGKAYVSQLYGIPREQKQEQEQAVFRLPSGGIDEPDIEPNAADESEMIRIAREVEQRAFNFQTK